MKKDLQVHRIGYSKGAPDVQVALHASRHRRCQAAFITPLRFGGSLS
jgi:hypothetical protein